MSMLQLESLQRSWVTILKSIRPVGKARALRLDRLHVRRPTSKVTGADETPAMTCYAGRRPVDRKVRRHFAQAELGRFEGRALLERLLRLQRVRICPPNRHSLEPRFKIENRRIHRFGRPCRVKIFPKVCDLTASSTQEHDVLLAVKAAGGFDQSFGLDLRHGGLLVCKCVDLWIDEAEV